MDITDAVVGIDTLGCQKEIAACIADQRAEYLLSLKRNQQQTFEYVEDTFRFIHYSDYHEDWEYDHGRYERRHCSVVMLMETAQDEIVSTWKDLSYLVHIQASRQTHQGTSQEIRYYLSNAQQGNATYFNKLVRGHWGIGNQLHRLATRWHLDVTFREDAHHARSLNAPENLNILQKIALQCISQMKDKLSGRRAVKRSEYIGFRSIIVILNKYLTFDAFALAIRRGPWKLIEYFDEER